LYEGIEGSHQERRRDDHHCLKLENPEFSTHPFTLKDSSPLDKPGNRTIESSKGILQKEGSSNGSDERNQTGSRSQRGDRQSAPARRAMKVRFHGDEEDDDQTDIGWRSRKPDE